jgi:drug/metabolite transporter (DMT)-like permease
MLAAAVVISQNLFGAFYSILSRRLSEELPHAQLQVSAVLYTIAIVLVLPFVWYMGDVSTAALQSHWPYVLLSGLATAVNGAIALLIFRYMDAAMGSLLMTTHVVAAVLAAMYVLGERLGLQEIAGAVVVVCAVSYALSVHVSRRERRNWTMGILLTLLGAFMFSVAAVSEKFLLDEIGLASFLAWGWSSQWLCAVVLSLLFGRRHYKQVLRSGHALLLWSAGLTRGMMGLMFVLSIVTLKSLCIAVVLAGMRPLFVSFLGAWILRERKFLGRKIVASALAAIGVAIMFWN